MVVLNGESEREVRWECGRERERERRDERERVCVCVCMREQRLDTLAKSLSCRNIKITKFLGRFGFCFVQAQKESLGWKIHLFSCTFKSTHTHTHTHTHIHASTQCINTLHIYTTHIHYIYTLRLCTTFIHYIYTLQILTVYTIHIFMTFINYI